MDRVALLTTAQDCDKRLYSLALACQGAPTAYSAILAKLNWSLGKQAARSRRTW